MAQKQFLGIKYPFSVENDMGLYLDLNETEDDKIKSEILHIIFTPKGQRLRMPEFGSDLIKYIFEPGDDESWSRMKDDIKTQIGRYLPNVVFRNITILKDEKNDKAIYASISYAVNKGNQTIENKILTRVI